MGKKNKKLNSQHSSDSHLPLPEGEIESGDFGLETLTTQSIKKSKKKQKLASNDSVVDDSAAQINSKEINESTFLGDDVIKKKKKKKRSKNDVQEPSEEVQNEILVNSNDDQPDIPKKKKKKSRISEEDIPRDIDEAVKMEDHKPQKNTKNKNKMTMVSGAKQETEIVPIIENKHLKKKNKGKNKAKTGAPVLNEEESQVTEEDIDKFIDELDEEDNKQYEDWVKLLDARLSKKTKAE